MILASLLASSKYIIVNKDLIQILGLNEAIILGELCSEYSYWDNINKLEENEYFYSTRENIQKNTGINAHFQRIAMKKLEEKGIINTKKKGIPCKTYYRIDEEKVIEYLKKAQLLPENSDVYEVNDKTLTEEIASTSEEKQQDVNKVNTNNNINNNTESAKKQFAEKVFMEQHEYNYLIKKFGLDLTNQLIEQLNLYKLAKRESYENDYVAILQWVTNRVKELEKEQKNCNNFRNKKKSNTKNYTVCEQRNYSPEFLNSFFCNLNNNLEVNENEKSI